MNRRDREIADPAEAIALLARCDTIRLGLNSSDGPYVVPLSFGLETDGERPIVYFHCAQRGLKADCIRRDPRVCVEADICHGMVRTPHGATARYESFIGFGTAAEVQGEEKMRGLRALLAHCGMEDYPLAECGSLAHTAVYKIKLTSFSGKRNLP